MALTKIKQQMINDSYSEIWVDAAAMVPRTTAGAAPATYEYPTNDLMSDYLLFDSITEEGAQFKLVMPGDWNLGTVKATFYWDASTGASISDAVTWGIAALAKSNDDAIDGTAFPTSVDTADSVLVADGGDVHIVTSASITIGGTPALGDLIWFEVTRLASGMAEDAKLFGVAIQYTRSGESAAW